MTQEIQTIECMAGCGRMFLSEELNQYGYCEDCIIECNRCNGEMELNSYYVETIGEYYCEDCYFNYVTSCDECGESYDTIDVNYCRNSHCDDYAFCSDYCADSHVDACDYEEDEINQGVHQYSYRPLEFHFHGENDNLLTGRDHVPPRYLGVELEIDDVVRPRLTSNDKTEDAAQLLKLSQNERLFYLKTDSSLTNGLEIVTHPATLKFHLESMPWSEIVETARELGYRSHNAKTCGIHVHVARNSLGRTHDAIELVVSRLIILIWRHWVKLWKFSRRRNDNYCRQQYMDDHVNNAALESAKMAGRYTALNLRNSSTIEFRLWRGTLNINTLRATLQMTDTLVRIARKRTLSWCAQSSWSDIAKYASRYTELAEYLESKNLN